MTQTPKIRIAITSAVSTSSTAVDISASTPDGTRWTHSLSVGESWRLPDSSAWERLNIVADVSDIIPCREQRLLFAHAGGAASSSRTRAFVQHVV
jgi:hypothetical protein